MIPYGHQSISELDIEAVIEVLKSDFLTQGPAVPRFESTVAQYCGTQYAAAMNSATSALHAACFAVDVGPGDEVWTSAITFAASANCALYCGATVDFVDIDGATFNMNMDALAEKLATAERKGRLPKAVIPVDMCGLPCDLERLGKLKARYGFRVIEDAAHAIGSNINSVKIGGSFCSDITVFSFHPVKIVTTAEGGIALTNNQSLHQRLELFRSHGITRDPEQLKRVSPGAWYYEQLALGFNYRLTDLQAALGISQMTRLDAFVQRRNEIAERYHELLAGLPLIAQSIPDKTRSAYHLYVVKIDPLRTRLSRARAFAAFRKGGVGVNVHYIPVYRHPYYEALGFTGNYCPEAERYYESAISLPMYPDLTDAELETVRRLAIEIMN
jgi:UDP-4-amino-4,6-dideoxy-N-acetyl-beta-L-altrosamine transaminase